MNNVPTDTDGLPGLRLETAASVTAREIITSHVKAFYHILRHDRAAGQSTAAAYIDGLAGVVALAVAGGHASKEDAIYHTVRSFKEALERDLQHLKKQ